MNTDGAPFDADSTIANAAPIFAVFLSNVHSSIYNASASVKMAPPRFAAWQSDRSDAMTRNVPNPLK